MRITFVQLDDCYLRVLITFRGDVPLLKCFVRFDILSDIMLVGSICSYWHHQVMTTPSSCIRRRRTIGKMKTT